MFDGRGRAKLIVMGQISQMIPNPTFERVARPSSAADYFMGKNPNGPSFREFIGDPITFVDQVESLPREDVAKIMGGNLQALLDSTPGPTVRPGPGPPLGRAATLLAEALGDQGPEVRLPNFPGVGERKVGFRAHPDVLRQLER